MIRVALAVLLIVGTVPAQTGTPESAPVPVQTFSARDSVEPVPFFRPKVVVQRQLVLPKDPFLGGALSLVLPGTGQAYCGRWGRGLGFLAGVLVSASLSGAVSKSNLADEAKSVGSGIFALAAIGVWAWNVLDGVNCANVHNRQLLQSP